jgi:hypothetical protein
MLQVKQIHNPICGAIEPHYLVMVSLGVQKSPEKRIDIQTFTLR